MMQHSGDVLVPLTPALLSDSDPGRVGRREVANDVQRVGDLRDLERIDRRHAAILEARIQQRRPPGDRKSTRLNSSHGYISYAVFCLKKKNEAVLEQVSGDGENE